MIVTAPRDPRRIAERLAPHRRVAVLGCGLCATACRTGGEPEVESAAAALAATGKEVVWTAVVDGVCHALLTRRELNRLPAADAVLVLACGSGVQAVAAGGATAVAGLETVYLGGTVRTGVFEERCALCGHCQVDDFAGLCPLTLCPKGILNGPCGGMVDGRCETGGDRECVWYAIHRRLEAAGKGSSLEATVPPRSWRRA